MRILLQRLQSQDCRRFLISENQNKARQRRVDMIQRGTAVAIKYLLRVTDNLSER
jgi:hypothetical protein